MRYFRLMTAVEWYIVRIHHSQLLNVEILAILLPMKRDFFAEAAGNRNIKVTRIQTNTRVGVLAKVHVEIMLGQLFRVQSLQVNILKGYFFH